MSDFATPQFVSECDHLAEDLREFGYCRKPSDGSQARVTIARGAFEFVLLETRPDLGISHVFVKLASSSIDAGVPFHFVWEKMVEMKLVVELPVATPDPPPQAIDEWTQARREHLSRLIVQLQIFASLDQTMAQRAIECVAGDCQAPGRQTRYEQSHSRARPR